MARKQDNRAANWHNRTLWTGDNLDILRGMNAEAVDLIYLDPPFNSNQTYAAPIGSEAAGAAFKDTWTLDDVDMAWHGEIAEQEPALYAIIDAAGLSHSPGMKSYLIMMAVRLLEMRRVLKPTGSIYLHCDPTASHYLKQLLDAIFGRAHFRNEIVWKRTSSHNRAKRWGPIHDVLLFYTRSANFTWNRAVQPLDESYIKKQYRYEDDRGRYRIDNLTAAGTRDGDTGEAWKGVNPTAKGRHWGIPAKQALPDWVVLPPDYDALTTRQRLDVLNAQGMIYWPKKPGGVPSFKRYLTEHSGSPVQDIVLDIAPLAAAQLENVAYPTQKPLALLERIITASSNPGDIVLDPFCGCATALVTAEHLNRQWVGIDLSPVAARLVKSRLEKEMGLFYDVHHRQDIPRRTDLGELPHYKTHKHSLFGRQEGLCGGCGVAFPFRNFTIDHIVSRAKGGTDHLDNLQLLYCDKAGGHEAPACGTDHLDNLQLLCGACNSAKGRGTQAELKARLRAQGVIGKGSGRRSA